MTHSHIDRDSLHEEVRRFIQSRFRPGIISDVWTKEEIAEDGEPILEITGVFEGSTDSFLEQKPRSLMQLLRNHLVALGEDSFPMLSFVSSAEAAV